MGAYTKLQAVNRMLRAASELPVSSIEDSGSSDTDVAVGILDEINIMFQLEGKYFNTDIVKLSLDSNGRIPVGATTLSLIPVNDWAHRDITVRGNYAWDADNGTDIFTETDDLNGIQFQRVVLLDFEDIPTSAQAYIMETASREYQHRVIGDRDVDAVLMEGAMEAKVRAVRESIKNRKGSWLISQSTTSKGIIGRAQDIRHRY